jgi:hypothetical protein
MHLFALSIYIACGLSLVLGVVVFIGNAIFRGDRKYEAKFPWWVRLSLYLLVLVTPLVGAISQQDMSLNASVWTNFLLGIVALAIPAAGLLGSLWLVAFRRTRERVKLGKGLLFVSLIPIVLLIGISVDPANRVVSRHRYSDRLLKENPGLTLSLAVVTSRLHSLRVNARPFPPAASV